MGLLTFLARRFVAGVHVDEAIRAAQALNEQGIKATIDHLGENVFTEEEATQAADAYLTLLDAISIAGVDSNVSLKLTMMGLEIDKDFCYRNVKRIVKKAHEHNNFVRIDMEGSPVTQITLDIYDHLREEFNNVGIVIQSYLRRSEADIIRLAARGDNVRLCKGAYKEPANVAFQRKEKVNENYLELGIRLLDGKGTAAFATHDREMIKSVSQAIQTGKTPTHRTEFQMLYGIERKLQQELANKGETVRVYIPYGSDWPGYFKRRMMERKENFLFAFKHFFEG